MAKTKKLPIWRLDKPLYLQEKDKNFDKEVKQLKNRGFCDSELWSLDNIIAAFILPRLKEFTVKSHSYPADVSSHKEWKKILQKMILAFEFYTNKKIYDDRTKVVKQVEEGLDLFRKYFMDLWG